MPRIAQAKLASVSAYSQSRAHSAEELPKETKDAYEKRTWREKAHTMPDGRVFIPPMALKMACDAAAKMLGIQVPGKGKATYTKFFTSGVLVLDGPVLPITKDELPHDWIHANADGVRGSGKRVWRCFPRIDEWEVTVDFHVLSDEITEDVFQQVLTQAGAFIGIGRFRPQNGGFYGRFAVDGIDWVKG